MKTYKVTISNGQKRDVFTLKAESQEEAHRLAHTVHIGTGWDVISVCLKKRNVRPRKASNKKIEDNYCLTF